MHMTTGPPTTTIIAWHAESYSEVVAAASPQPAPFFHLCSRSTFEGAAGHCRSCACGMSSALLSSPALSSTGLLDDADEDGEDAPMLDKFTQSDEDDSQGPHFASVDGDGAAHTRKPHRHRLGRANGDVSPVPVSAAAAPRTLLPAFLYLLLTFLSTALLYLLVRFYHLPPSCTSMITSSLPSSSLPAALRPLAFNRTSVLPPHLLTAPSHVCIPTFGNGRWGNQVFIITMGVFYANLHHMALHLPPMSIGHLFQHYAAYNTTCRNTTHAVRFQEEDDSHDFWRLDPYPPAAREANDSITVRIEGYFQYHTLVYAPVRWQMQEMLRPMEEVHQQLMRLRDALMERQCQRGLIIAMHVRRGDFSADNPEFVPWNPKAIPVAWYTTWLQGIVSTRDFAEASRAQQEECSARFPQSPPPASLSSFSVLLMSDELDRARVELQAADAGLAVVTTPELMKEGQFHMLQWAVDEAYIDWWLLGHVYMMATSHSTFSLTAAMFNPLQERAKYYRPQEKALGLEAFEPWNFYYDFKDFSDILP